MIHACLYEGARNHTPIAQDDFETFEELADTLCDLADREYGPPSFDATTATADERDAVKLTMFAWAPHVLSEPRRSNANVLRVTFLALDVDAFAESDTPEALTERAAEISPLGGLVYASPSDAPGARRVRVVLPISRPVPPHECAPLRMGAAVALGLDPIASGVAKAPDAARIFFAGRLRGTAPREVWRW